MTLRELQYAIARGEGLHVEFKRKLPQWAKLMREVVAFANTEGGTVFIGVGDDGEMAGIKDPIEVTEAIKLNLRQYARPALKYRVEIVRLNWKRAIVCIHVPAGDEKPYLALEEARGEKGTALIRLKDESTTASREMYQLLKYQGRERNMRVEYGEKEKKLMQYLSEEPFITLKKYSDIAGINLKAASRTLVHLVKANVLRIEPGVDRDRYYQVE